MAHLTESAVWEDGIYRLELTDPVVGGEDGKSNVQAKQLANRTSFLKKQIDDFLSSENKDLVSRVSDLETSRTADEKNIAGLQATTTAMASDVSDAVEISGKAETIATTAQKQANENLAFINWLDSLIPSTWFTRPQRMYAYTEPGSNGCTVLMVPGDMSVVIDGTVYHTIADKQVSINDNKNWDVVDYARKTKRNGQDVYVYACKPASGTIPDIILSVNSTCPDTRTETDSRKIGGFHCICQAVGTISGHYLSDFDTGDIIPNSVWDLKWRPVANPEGMVCIAESYWADIYLNCWDISLATPQLVSKYLGTIADGYTESEKFHGEHFIEKLGLIKKRLMTRDEFLVMSQGSNTGTNIYGSTDPGETGGHIDTLSRRMVSNWGLEDCCGAMWQHTGNIYGLFNLTGNSETVQYGGLNTDPAVFETVGSDWDSTTRSTFNSKIDTSSFGSPFGAFARIKVGGCYEDGEYCGPRCIKVSDLSTKRDWTAGVRGVSEFLHWDN